MPDWQSVLVGRPLTRAVCVFTRGVSGLDPNRYKNTAVGESEERQFSTFDSLMSDEERFKDAEPLLIRCHSCKGTVAFAPITDRAVRRLSSFRP